MVAAVLVAETALTLADTGAAVALPDSGTATSATVSASAQYGAAEARDATSALLMARLQNGKIEVLSERTSDSTTFALPDGSMQTEDYAGPIRVKQDGDWHDIDTDLSDTGPALEPQVAAADIAVSDGGDTDLASVAKGGESFGLGWEDKLPTPTVKDATASYDLGDGQTLAATALAQGFSENIKLDSRPTDKTVSYRIPLHLKGLTLSQADSGHLLLKDADGKLVAEAPAPMMWDASKDEASGESAHEEQVATKIETADDGSQTLVLTPASDFLDTATYPVTVDPTSTLAVTTDTWVQTPDYPDSQVSSQELKSGTYDSGSDIARAYLKFDVSKFAGTDITSATMKLYNYYSSTCSTSGAATQARRITSTWSSSSVTWSAQPSTTTTGMATNTGHWGYSSSCPAAWSNWNMQSIVQAWADGSTNYGIQLRSADETDSTTWRRFRSANYTTSGYAPKLVVTYNSYPAKPSSVAVSPSAVNAYNGKRYVTTYTPTLSAKVSDPDGSTVKAQFEITNDPAYASDPTYSYTATSSSVSSGGTATLAIPSVSQLTASHLRLRVRGYDGTDYGSWSSYLYFVPNVAKPSVPTISCSPYSSGSWTDKSSSGATCTLSTTSTDGAGYKWGLDDKTVPNSALDTTDGTGGESQTITVKPGNGWHTLYARTIDSGGNVSTSTTSYAFGVGKAGLASPVTGDTTDDDVTLSATQSGAFTGVTYEYRIGDSVGWQPIPVTYVTKDGSAISSWPVSFSSSANPADLIWAATSQLADDGPVQVRALFTDGTNTYGTDAATVTVDRKADNAPISSVGPGAVNLLTGDFGLDATDAGAFSASVTRTFSSRDPLAGAGQSGQVAIFGPNWSPGITASTSDWTYVKQTSTTSVAVMDVNGGQTGFTLNSSGAWTPEPGAENLTLALANDKYTLKDSGGSVTTFAKVSSTAPTWQVTTSYTVSDSSANTTTVVSRAVNLSDGTVLAEPQYVIAPTSAVSATSCASDPSTADCRVLEFVYASDTTATSSALGDYAGQVKQIKLWATAPGGSAATATTVAQYAYDTSGHLREAWGPRLDSPLKTAYTYDSAGRVATETDPGQLPWTFTYGKVGTNGDAGDGMLLSVSRPTLKAGSESTTDGTATTSVVYDVPVSGTSAPNQMGSATTATWEQHDNPVYGAAVFPAGTVPSSHDGSTLGSGDYATATITYLDADGREVNTAVPGGHIATTEYDADGDVTRELTAENRELALATTTSPDPLVAGAIAGTSSTADAADLLSTLTEYTTGTDGVSLASDVYEPLHTVTLQHALSGGTSDADLAAGTEVLARTHTVYAYDEGRPSDAKVSDLLTSTTVGASVTGYPADGDKSKGTSTYDWAAGFQLTSVTDPSGLALTTTYTYDSDGNLLSTTGPNKNSTTETVTTYWSATGSGTCQGRPEWAGLTCRVAPGAAITGGGSNPSELVTKAYTYDRFGEPDTVTETANGSTRTTAYTRDAAGRVTKKAISGGKGTDTPDTTYSYGSATGLLATQASNSQTITHTYDSLGRQISYNDGSGNTTTTAYDSLNRPVTVTDSVPSTTTYTYDSITGYPAKVTDSVAGTFTATAYDADGDLTAETLPGGYSFTQTYNTIGAPTGRTYTDSSNTTVLDDQADYTILGTESGHTENNGASTSTGYTYDAAGRLTQAQDDTGATCTTRAYTFASSTSWDRTKFATDTSTTDCADTTTTTTSTATHTYDSADRITDTGYTYDSYGRTLTTPDATLTYYTNDLARSEATSATKQTWSLDAEQRQAVTTNATSTDGGITWTDGTTATNHYGDDTDSPTWTTNSSGTVTRSVLDVAGALGATTSASGAITLQLADLHGDIAVTLATATTTATAYSYDEYGNTTNTSRYGWQGDSLRSSDTPTGITLMGLRLYSPTTGRFLQTDPVQNGSATSYDYCNGDPVNCSDLNGQCPSWRHPVAETACYIATGLTEGAIDLVGEVFCGAVATAVLPLCSAIVMGLGAAVSYYVETRWDGGYSWQEALSRFATAAFRGGVLGAGAKRFLKTPAGKTFLRKARSFLASAAEKVESKLARVHLHLHLSGLVTRIANAIKNRLG